MKNDLENSNTEAEMSLLGACLIDMDAIEKIIDLLPSTAFYKKKHRLIYEAMMLIWLHDEEMPIDIVTVIEQLKKNKVYDKVGGSKYLTELVMVVPTSAHILHYYKIIMDHWKKRKGGEK